MLNQLDYKGKYFILQDEEMELDFMDYSIGTMSKEQVLDKKFIKSHKESCRYFGIPPYIGKDKELRKVFG